MIKEEFIFTDAELEPETVTLTRAEIDALTAYAEKLRRETIKAIFTDVEDLLQLSYRVEASWASMCENPDERGNFLYGRNLCTKLIIDLQKIERKYTDEANQV